MAGFQQELARRCDHCRIIRAVFPFRNEEYGSFALRQFPKSCSKCSIRCHAAGNTNLGNVMVADRTPHFGEEVVDDGILQRSAEIRALCFHKARLGLFAALHQGHKSCFDTAEAEVQSGDGGHWQFEPVWITFPGMALYEWTTRIGEP